MTTPTTPKKAYELSEYWFIQFNELANKVKDILEVKLKKEFLYENYKNSSPHLRILLLFYLRRMLEGVNAPYFPFVPNKTKQPQVRVSIVQYDFTCNNAFQFREELQEFIYSFNSDIQRFLVNYLNKENVFELSNNVLRGIYDELSQKGDNPLLRDIYLLEHLPRERKQVKQKLELETNTRLKFPCVVLEKPYNMYSFTKLEEKTLTNMDGLLLEYFTVVTRTYKNFHIAGYLTKSNVFIIFMATINPKVVKPLIEQRVVPMTHTFQTMVSDIGRIINSIRRLSKNFFVKALKVAPSTGRVFSNMHSLLNYLNVKKPKNIGIMFSNYYVLGNNVKVETALLKKFNTTNVRNVIVEDLEGKEYRIHIDKVSGTQEDIRKKINKTIRLITIGETKFVLLNKKKNFLVSWERDEEKFTKEYFEPNYI